MKKSGAAQRREKLRDEYWSNEDPWTGENDKGWFRAPRTIPLILSLLESKELSGNYDPTKVYLELLARHIGEGLIEMASEQEHAFAAGYEGSRAVRSWQERMKVLEKNGFIKTRKVGNQQFRYVLIVHPTTVIQQLRDNEKISQHWWDTYRSRQIQIGEASYNDRQAQNKQI